MLNKLIDNKSKHSQYQSISPLILSHLNFSPQITKPRYEKERMDYILSKIDIENKVVADIGGNTGYFSFEMIENGAQHLDYYEINHEHAEFVKTCTDTLKLGLKINIYNDKFDFNKNTKKYDLILLLNVLHHIGDDFDPQISSIQSVKKRIIDYVNIMAGYCNTLIFQIGFNWKGNPKLPLFENGTKKEMIDLIRHGTKNKWHTSSIGIPVNQTGIIKYEDLSVKNISRDDSLGEFLNRPLFIFNK